MRTDVGGEVGEASRVQKRGPYVQKKNEYSGREAVCEIGRGWEEICM